MTSRFLTTTVLAISLVIGSIVLPGIAHAQTDPHQHGDTTTPPATSATPATPPASPSPAPPPASAAPQSGTPATGQPAAHSMHQMMEGMMRPMMQRMMQQMMKSGAAKDGTQDATGDAPKDGSRADADRATRMGERMRGPMMRRTMPRHRVSDPDEAYVQDMIALHQEAIEIARHRLQYGRDYTTRKWAEATIRDRQREIDQMQDWLRNAER